MRCEQRAGVIGKAKAVQQRQPMLPLPQKHLAPSPMNSITLVGRVGTALETRDVNGTPVSQFRLVVNRTSRDEEPDWFSIEIWGRQSDLAQQLLSAGALVGVIGTLRMTRWVDKTTGEKRSRPVIRSSFFEVLPQSGGRAAHGDGPGVDGQAVEQPRRPLPQRIATQPAPARPADVPF